MQRLPLGLKIGYTIFLIVWIPTYWVQYGPSNFLWLCDIANLILAVALWRDSALLVSSQAVSVLLIQVALVVDLGVALIAGIHPIGGTEYMFDPQKPLPVRLLSLFHVAMPPFLLWCLWRLGYDRRGWKLQTVFAWVILPLSFLAGDAETNLNWLWSLFGWRQTLVSPPLFVPIAMVLYPLVLYLPSHALLRRLYRSRWVG